mmetsp:Transcript_121081/g.170336  ORF Transcript_121081/g.170336 Transcript_121081/m.170336 type:complete len:134 (-) Transcript_121081:44-445(-)
MPRTKSTSASHVNSIAIRWCICFTTASMEVRKGHTLDPQPMGISDIQLGSVVGASTLEAMLVVDVVEEPGPGAPDVLAVVVVVVGVVVAEVEEVAIELVGPSGGVVFAGLVTTWAALVVVHVAVMVVVPSVLQ